MATCREIEKMVMPYINHQLDETQLEQFLKHVKNCPACREELEIYYTVSVGLWQLDSGNGVYDIAVLWRRAWKMPGLRYAPHGFGRSSVMQLTP